MQTESRTSKSIKNAAVNVFYLLLQTLIGFWSRKVFYDYLGSEVLGLSTTAASLLQFLNIAESGIGTAVAYFLYTPLYEDDQLSIRKIVALQGWIYRRIATFILVAAMLLMCVFPWIFEDINVPLWYAYAIFGVLLCGNMLGYYVNYRSSLLSADQKNYKVVKTTQVSNILLNIMLIVGLPYCSQPFILYLGTTLIGYIIGAVWLNHVIYKEYPWLKSVEQSGRELLREYPDMLKKTRQLFIHKIAGFAVYQLNPLIMYSFGTLTIIAYYGNYLSIVERGRILIAQAFSSTNAAIGSVVASKNTSKMLHVFWELIDSRLFFSTTVVFVLSQCTEPFISIWLSPNYLLGKPVLYLLLLTTWLFLNRSVIEAYKDAFGIFQDVWAPIIECVVTISFAIIGGYVYGFAGVLLGNIVNLLCVIFCWKPYYTFKKGFKLPSSKFYFIPYFGRIILTVLAFSLLYYFVNQYTFTGNTFLSLVIYALVLSCISVVYFYAIYLMFTSGMRSFNKRMTEIIRAKISRFNA